MNLLTGRHDKGAGRGRLRRVSQERARAATRAARREPIGQAGEKLAVGVTCGVLMTALLGAGAGLELGAWLGLAGVVAALLTFFVRYLLDFRSKVFGSLSRTLALGVFLVSPLVAARAFETVVGLEAIAFLPISFIALVVALTWNRAFAIECTVFTTSTLVLYALLRGEPAAVPGLFIATAGALAAVLSARHVRRRSTLVRIGLITGGVQAAVCAAFLLVPGGFGGLTVDGAWMLPQLALQGLTVGLLVSGLLPAIETVFGVTTDISLLELGNTHEQPLLRKLLLEAPGTFHHSYIVGLLAEAAAEAVGANALLARVGSLYHDVGKLNKPAYFAENSPEARARHKSITPEMSALIISAHPRDGVELGGYYGLPQAVLDFMPEHHGTNLIEYFYHQARKLRGEANVREETFRYPGPRPQSIETAIVMIADAVEAISRQMPDTTQSRLSEMVREVAYKRLMERQFDECGMTLRDLDLIQDAFVRVLLGIYHTRPTFPKGRPHPLDLSQSGELRRAALDEEQPGRKTAGGPS